MKKFCEIESRADLAVHLGLPLQKLTYILYEIGTENYYKTFEIPKKNGDLRQINAPQGDLKEVQRKLANSLWAYHIEYCKSKNFKLNISHAFEKKKSIITNSIIHRNKRYVLNFDLENFFDSFHFGRVRGYFEKNQEFNLPVEIATIIAQLTCYKGCLPQGAPSSPIITNLISNILDMRLIKIARKHKMNYTRYADDMTFSTNDSKFLDFKELFINELTQEVIKSGFSLNNRKTRLIFRDSRQEVTGLVVNKKINVIRDYSKKTRSMAHNLYRFGEFSINDSPGTIKQLEGRFSFINQLDYYNNNLGNEKKRTIYTLNSREKQYQKFLFYKYFYSNSKPLIVTEGKTDISYIKAALKKEYKKYPELITKRNNRFDFHISFLRKTRRLKYFFGLEQDGADSMKNIYNLYCCKNGFPNIYDYISEKNKGKPSNPVILLYDNEQKTERPLKKFISYAAIKVTPQEITHRIVDNLFLLTNPLVKGKGECEIEDLFDDTVLSHTIGGKKFSRDSKIDNSKCYGKAIFSDYIMKNYMNIDFSEFTLMFDGLNSIIKEFRNA